jgi:glyoxalase family protein
MVLTDILDYKLAGQEGNRYRYVTDAVTNAAIVDLIEAPTVESSYNASGTIHHVAFRVRDEKVLMEFREKVVDHGLPITDKIDRNYFFSLYFREPGGVLFELATDNPGFTVDEPLAELGSHLKLPPQHERNRAAIEKVLPDLG